MTDLQAANVNHLWATLLIEELVRNGVDTFCVAPGSRSTPLVVALARNGRARTVVHYDERGALFHALATTPRRAPRRGHVTTSGTPWPTCRRGGGVARARSRCWC